MCTDNTVINMCLNYSDFFFNDSFMTNFFNLSEPMDDILSGFHTFLITAYTLVFFFGTVGNILVICIVLKKHQRQRLVDIFIGHLAVADMVFLITLPLWTASLSLHGLWPFGNFMCKLASYVICVNMFSSIYFLTCMSVDRFMAIVLALDTRRVRTKRYAQGTALFVWLFSMGLGIHVFFFRAVDGNGHCVDDLSLAKTVFSLLIRVIAFLLPLLTIGICYTSVAIKLHQHFQQNNRVEWKKRRSLRVGLWILALFLLAWLPFNVLVTIQTLRESGYLDLDPDTKLEHGLALATCLAFSNSCINPFIYFWLDGCMRRQLLGLLPYKVAGMASRRRSSLTLYT
uniref:G-protein coupled receptors family 1 profile domain-containing protein n=1 Tax=Scleropages formosus TaxID=113540 RepID=A0A8C9QY19_SCLFO